MNVFQCLEFPWLLLCYYMGQKKQKCQVSLLLQFVVGISIKWLAYTVIKHTHKTQPFNGLWSGTTRVGRYRKKHPLTPILIIGHPLSFPPFTTINGILFVHFTAWHPLYSTYVLDSPLVQPLSRSSLVFFLVLHPQLHTPHISSPNHLLFVAHAHTNAACSAAIPMLCHLYLVSLSQLLTWESVF